MRSIKPDYKEKLNRIYKKSGVAAVAFALLIGLSYFFAMKYGYNEKIGHFDNTVWFALLVGATVAAALCGAVLAFLGRGLTALPEEKKSQIGLQWILGTVGHGVCAAASLALFIKFCAEYFSRTRTFTMFEKFAGFLMIFVTAAMLSSLIGDFLGKKGSALLYIFAALSVNFTVFSHYFDFTVSINSPQRNISTVLYCALLLFLISEARFCLPAQSERSTAAFMSFVNFFTVAACAGFPCGMIVFRVFTGAETDGVPQILWLVLCIGAAVVALSRLMQSDMVFTEKTKKESKSDKGDKNG